MDYDIQKISTLPVQQYLTAFPVPVKADLQDADIRPLLQRT